MTTNIDVDAFKKAGFSFEEIESLRISEKEIEAWVCVSLEDMNLFIQNELFAQYTANA